LAGKDAAGPRLGRAERPIPNTRRCAFTSATTKTAGFGRSKNFKKSGKKACQVSESSINEEKLADKPADFPFKNILKK
jgi:hypothetical protein